MRSTLVCASVSHGNTRRIADAIAPILQATVIEPEGLDPERLGDDDLVGFGSGIFLGSFHDRLLDGIRALPDRQHAGTAFVFATSGFPEFKIRPFTAPVVKLLRQKGFDVLDTFVCRGWDTFWPFKPVGGLRKGRPAATDLQAARSFAERIRAGVG